MSKCKARAKRSLCMLLAAFLLVGMLAGCGQTPAPEAKPETTQNPPAAENDKPSTPEPEQKEEPKANVITDMKGREVTIPEDVKTIATFGACGVLNTLIETMGRGDMICNDMAPSFTKTKKWAMQYEFAPQITGAPVLQNADGDIIIEEALKLNPDLCFTMQPAMIEPLEQAGLTVVYFNWDVGDELKAAVTLLGDILGEQERAADYCKYFDESVKKAEGLISGVAQESKRKVIYGDVVGMSNPHKISEWWITQGGGISVTEAAHTEQSLTYTMEDLLAWNPDVMFVTNSQTEDLKNDAQLATITAVANDAVYVVPTVGHTWGNRSTEQPLVIFWTINKLYPELYPVDQFKADIKDFYSRFFNYELSEEQLANIAK